MEPWRVYRQVVKILIALLRSRIRIRIHNKVKNWIRTRIIVMRIRNLQKP